MKKTIVGLSLIAVLVLSANCGNKSQPRPAEFTARIETVDSMYVASIPGMGPYREAGKLMGELWAWIGKNKITPQGMLFGIYYDDPVKVNPDSTRYEVAIAVPAATRGDKKVLVKKSEPMEMASTIYIGPYETVGQVYPKLGAWIAQNKYTIMGPGYEFYLSDPTKVPPESCMTKVAFPVTSTAP